MTTETAAPLVREGEEFRTPAPRWASLAATFFGAGHLRPGPGTWGSLSALLIWSAVAWVIPEPWRLAAVLLTTAVTVAIGIPAATRLARSLGNEDPSCVVVDEVAGQLLAFAAVPLHWKTLLAAFILFRAFDILKPPPVRQLERLHGGTGIMMDDIGAGLYALLVMQLLLHFRVL